MATLAKSEVADRALEAIGIKAAGQSAAAEDANRAQESVDSVYQMLRKEGLAPFAVATVPEWAQPALIHLVAFDLAATFGLSGDRLQSVSSLAQKGHSDLATQVFGKRHPAPIKAEYF